ncbi:MAG: hypothetical protein ACFCU8_07105 [Thermosynechococcaceae cyanobacterium]
MARLHQKIQQERSAIETAVHQTGVYLDKLSVMSDKELQAARVNAIALNLHAFYTGTERILTQVAKTCDGSLPTGTDWHRQSLLQMATPVEEIRLPLISEALLTRLDEFRRFRHVVRSNYAHVLEPEQVIRLAEQLRECYHEFEGELQQWLQSEPASSLNYLYLHRG